MDGWMDTANKVCSSYTVAIEPLLELDFYLYRFSFLFSSMLCLTLLTWSILSWLHISILAPFWFCIQHLGLCSLHWVFHSFIDRPALTLTAPLFLLHSIRLFSFAIGKCSLTSTGDMALAAFKSCCEYFVGSFSAGSNVSQALPWFLNDMTASGRTFLSVEILHPRFSPSTNTNCNDK